MNISILSLIYFFITTNLNYHFIGILMIKVSLRFLDKIGIQIDSCSRVLPLLLLPLTERTEVTAQKLFCSITTNRKLLFFFSLHDPY